MSRSHVLASVFVVCVSLLFITTFAQKQKQQNLQQHLPPPPPKQEQQQSLQNSAPNQQQQQQNLLKSRKQLQLKNGQHHLPPPPPQRQQQQSPQVNQSNVYNQQKHQQQHLPSPPPQQQQQSPQLNQNNSHNQPNQQQLQMNQSNIQTPVDQNGKPPKHRLHPTIVTTSAANALKYKGTQYNRVHFIKDFLHEHNEARRQYHLPPYSWDNKLERYARAWGYKRFLDCKMVHSYGPYGENLFWGYQEHWTNREAVKHWVEESQFYNSDQNHCAPQKVCGHFTQVVWKDSVRVGCARQKCNNGSVLVICEYDPPGNYVNEHPLKTNI